MDSKEYYKTGRRSTWKPSPMRQYLIKEIIRSDLDAETVFEFGCGRGETLAILKMLGYLTYGLEINSNEVVVAHSKGILGVVEGDETDMKHYGDNMINISFTIGVMDHLDAHDFVVALREMERITNDTIFCLETNDVVGDYYYPHNYGKVGFTAVKEFDSEDDGARYVLWRKDVIGK